MMRFSFRRTPSSRHPAARAWAARQSHLQPGTTAEHEIVARFASLFPHEVSALLAALRRDALAQLDKAATDAAHASSHLFNHRMVTRVLDMLAPSEYEYRPTASCRALGAGPAARFPSELPG